MMAQKQAEVDRELAKKVFEEINGMTCVAGQQMEHSSQKCR